EPRAQAPPHPDGAGGNWWRPSRPPPGTGNPTERAQVPMERDIRLRERPVDWQALLGAMERWRWERRRWPWALWTVFWDGWSAAWPAIWCGGGCADAPPRGRRAARPRTAWPRPNYP